MFDLSLPKLLVLAVIGDLNPDQAAQQQPQANGTPLTPGERPPPRPYLAVFI